MINGYLHSLKIHSGLAYISVQPYTNHEWDMLPHVWILEHEWDPTIFDSGFKKEENWFDALLELDEDPTSNLFDEYGNYCLREISSAKFPSKTMEVNARCIDGEIHKDWWNCDGNDDNLPQFPFDPGGESNNILVVDSPKSTKKPPDYESLCPNFA